MGKIQESFIPMPSTRPARIAIFSDAHGNMHCFASAIHLAASLGPVDGALYLGDYVSDASLLAELAPAWPAFLVRGNNDYMNHETPNEILLTIGSRKLYATHGHHYAASVRSQRLAARGKQMGADVVTYGHTHIAKTENIGGCTVINPGSVAYPRDNRDPSFVLLQLCDANTEPILHFFKGT